MQSKGDGTIFEYRDDVRTVFLNTTTRSKILSGNLCPSEKSLTLTFDLTSNVYSPSTQKFDISIEPESFEAFEGVNINDSNQVKEE